MLQKFMLKEGSGQKKKHRKSNVAISGDILGANSSEKKPFIHLFRKKIEVERTIKKASSAGYDQLFRIALMDLSKRARQTCEKERPNQKK
jgi:hypothetical protein